LLFLLFGLILSLAEDAAALLVHGAVLALSALLVRFLALFARHKQNLKVIFQNVKLSSGTSLVSLRKLI
jgi:NhaP-type Na+/H+ or K+/H+ antiporter